MPVRLTPTTLLLSSLTLAPLLAAGCGDDPTGSDEFPGRVPCASQIDWNGDLSDTRQFDYDDHKRLLTRLGFGDGTLYSTETFQWEGYHPVRYELTFDQPWTVIDYTWDGDQLIMLERTDLDGIGLDSSYTRTHTYDGRAQIGMRLDFHDPTRVDRVVTITGDRSRQATWRDCPDPADGSPCSVCVQEQPDSDPEHWNAASCDWDDDGVIDDVFTRTMDRHFLDLSFTMSDLIDGLPQLVTRETYQREDDGTLLWWTDEEFSDGALTDLRRETFQFDCPAARTAAAPSSPAAPPPVRAVRPGPLSTRWRAPAP